MKKTEQKHREIVLCVVLLYRQLRILLIDGLTNSLLRPYKTLPHVRTIYTDQVTCWLHLFPN